MSIKKGGLLPLSWIFEIPTPNIEYIKIYPLCIMYSTITQKGKHPLWIMNIWIKFWDFWWFPI